jgi:hypothetical protein
MRQKRRKISLSRRRYDQVEYQRRSADKSKLEPQSDIIDIWREQKRIRDEEAALEREYEAAKKRLRDIKIQMKRNQSILSDASDLQTSFFDETQLKIQNSRLWLAKSYGKFKLSLTIFYIKLRSKLGIPLKRGAGLRSERIALAVVALIALAGIAFVVWDGGEPNNEPVAANQDNSAPAAEIPTNVTPQFAVLTPGGQGAGQLGGFALVSPEGKDPVYAYADKLGNVNIRVSQQQLPQNFKDDPSTLTKLASDYNVNRTLTAGQTTIYIGRSEKGPQSVIFSQNNLLILISSDGVIADKDWVSYIENLKL